MFMVMAARQQDDLSAGHPTLREDKTKTFYGE